MPSRHSRAIEKIDFGNKINFELIESEIINTTQSTRSGYGLKGKWLKINYNNQIGYLFNGDISDNMPPIKMINGTIKIDYEQILGKKLNDKSITETVDIENKSYEVKTLIDSFENGFYSYSAFDGCFNHNYTFMNLSFIEVFHLAISKYSFKFIDELILPRFFEEQNGEIRFWGAGDLVGEVIIRKTKNGWQIYSYDCN